LRRCGAGALVLCRIKRYLQRGGQLEPACERAAAAVVIQECAADRVRTRLELEDEAPSSWLHSRSLSRP
jgi:hypothetical protein